MLKKHKSIKPQLSKRNLQRAQKILFDVVDLFEKHEIGYHLEGGTLLGMVRDNGMIPWDWDVDLSFLAEDTDTFLKVCDVLKAKGYKITNRRLKKNVPPFKKGNYRVFKVKPFLLSILKECLPFFKRIYVTADVFVKYRDGSQVYWLAKEKIMRVDKRYYESFETIECYGRVFRVPNHYREYLTEKYGDWSKPVKVWDCSRDEKTICGKAE